MKAILINPENKTVIQIELEKGIDAIYKQLDCDVFTAPVVFENDDTLYCDDEGLFKPEMIGGIIYPDWSYPIVGKSLIIGTNDEGESVDCKSTIDDIKKGLTWVSKEEAEKWADNFR